MEPMAELSFVVEGLRIETRGLRPTGHPELALEVAKPEQLKVGQVYLGSLAAQVIASGRGFAAGEEVAEQGLRHRFEVATLELWELDSTGRFSPGCALLMSQLLGGE
jgi:hypothetical protein